jgi:hypothetical protein
VKSPSTDPSASRLLWLRRVSLGVSAMLLVQYGLGIGVNLYLRVPAADQHRGVATAFWRSLSRSPVTLAIHAAYGLLLVLASINVLVRALRARARYAVVLSLLGMLAVVAAGLSGVVFVDRGREGASMAMAILTGVALLCYLLNLFLLSSAGEPRASAGSEPGGDLTASRG